MGVVLMSLAPPLPGMGAAAAAVSYAVDFVVVDVVLGCRWCCLGHGQR